MPIVYDIMNPSSPSGWKEQEKLGFKKRTNFEFGLYLAIIHHICLGENVPLPEFIDWVLNISKNGIIEFVSIDDPNSKKLLYFKKNIFLNYNKDNFENLLKQKAKIIDYEKITNSRWIYAFEKN